MKPMRMGGLTMKKTLIVVDMQNDFIDMALGTKEAMAIVPKVKAKIEEYVKNGDEIIFTRDTHFENYLDTAEGKKLPVPHCIKGSDGWELAPEIAEALSGKKYEKFQKETFGATALPAYMQEKIRHFDEIELFGICTDICVISNALILKNSFPEIPITVHSALCAGVTPEKHEAALEVMRSCQINVI